MKKALVFILTILYISSASGATVNIHYCMGKYSGWELGHEQDNSCGSCGMDKSDSGKDNCCRDEHKTLKLTDVHKSAESFVNLLHAPVLSVHNSHTYSQDVPLASITENLPAINAPPALTNQRVYLFIRSIRI